MGKVKATKRRPRNLVIWKAVGKLGHLRARIHLVTNAEFNAAAAVLVGDVDDIDWYDRVNVDVLRDICAGRKHGK